MCTKYITFCNINFRYHVYFDVELWYWESWPGLRHFYEGPVEPATPEYPEYSEQQNSTYGKFRVLPVFTRLTVSRDKHKFGSTEHNNKTRHQTTTNSTTTTWVWTNCLTSSFIQGNYLGVNAVSTLIATQKTSTMDENTFLTLQNKTWWMWLFDSSMDGASCHKCRKSKHQYDINAHPSSYARVRSKLAAIKYSTCQVPNV